jgi:hypothetical protein
MKIQQMVIVLSQPDKEKSMYKHNNEVDRVDAVLAGSLTYVPGRWL